MNNKEPKADLAEWTIPLLLKTARWHTPCQTGQRADRCSLSGELKQLSSGAVDGSRPVAFPFSAAAVTAAGGGTLANSSGRHQKRRVVNEAAVMAHVSRRRRGGIWRAPAATAC